MSSRRFAVALVAVWLAGSLFMSWVASHNLSSADEVMRFSGDRVLREMRDIGLDRTRELLRFHAAEMNRHYFYYWEAIQLGLGLTAGVVILFASNGSKLLMGLCGAMLVLVVILHFTITPQMIEIGRGLDFAPPDQMLDERKAHAGFHGYYMALEGVKVFLGLVLLLGLLRQSRPRRRRSSKEVDLVDDADHSHVNR